MLALGSHQDAKVLFCLARDGGALQPCAEPAAPLLHQRTIQLAVIAAAGARRALVTLAFLVLCQSLGKLHGVTPRHANKSKSNHSTATSADAESLV